MRRKTAMVLASVVALTVLTTACSKKSGDPVDMFPNDLASIETVEAKSYATDELLNYAVSTGAFKGIYNEGDSLDTPVKRADFVTILSRHYACGYSLPVKPDMEFDDVPYSADCAGAVYWAESASLTDGSTATNFFPDDAISREDAAAILYRYAAASGFFMGVERTSASAVSNDSETASYAAKAIQYLKEYGIIEDDGSFDPEGNLTMEECINWYARLNIVIDQNLQVQDFDLSGGSFAIVVEGTEET